MKHQKNIYYLYEKSRKKLCKLSKLYQLLKNEYEVYGTSIKPQSALGMRWIDPKMNAMRQIIDKYTLHVSHLQKVSAHI